MRRTPSFKSTCGRQPSTRSPRVMSRQDRFRSPRRAGWNSGSSGVPTAAATAVQLSIRGLESGAHVEAQPAADIGAGLHERVDDVIVDEDVVAGIGAVAEHLGGLAVEQGLREDRDDTGLAVRILTRPRTLAGAICEQSTSYR